MLDTTIAYPEFVPNQILTDSQLNQLREHLDREGRITRLRLAGTGIVCGLRGSVLRAAAPRGIRVTAGYGLTSDGYLIEVCPTATYTHFREYADPDRDEDLKLRYAPWRLPTDATHVQQLPIAELVDAETMAGEDPPPATAFTAANIDATIDGRVLVLYVEHQPVELNSCLVTSCDNRGRNINVRVRALLVRQSDLTALAGCPAEPALHRIPRLPAIAQAANVNAAFAAVVASSVAGLSASIKTLFDAHAPLLDLETVAADPLLNKLTNASHVAQYRYGALVDFAAAYNEAATAAYALVRECCPSGNFPRHLMLGALSGSPAPGFRQEFAPAAIRNAVHGEMERVRELFVRLSTMVTRVGLSGHPASVSIRPSHGARFPLGHRARPFYFTHADLDASWRPHQRCTLDADWPWLHPSTPPALATDYLESTLLRIEGHVGAGHQAAHDAVAEERRAGNVEFEIVRSYLADDSAAERAARAELRAQLLASQAMWVDARRAFDEGVFGGADGSEEIAAVARRQLEAIKEHDAISRAWVDLRARRTLHCDTAALSHDYLEARSELICLAGRLRAGAVRLRREIELTADEAFVGAGLDAMLETVPLVLVDELAAALLASPEDWDDEDKVQARLEQLAGDRSTPRMLRGALLASLLAVEGRLRQLLELTLPRQLADFDYELCAHRFRLLLTRVREFMAWSGALQVPLSGADTGIVLGDAPLHASELTALDADLLALQGCVLARLATVAFAYEEARRSDLSLFENLRKLDGLEHRAGVTPGGTFVLVCDTPASAGRVIADFSLDGCLPCCCEVDTDAICLPPLALPDVRVVTLPRVEKEEERLPIDLTIAVAANDCDLNGGSAAEMTVQQALDAEGQPVFTSERGAKAVADPANGTVHYTFSTGDGLARPGLIDRFSYRLRLSGQCEGEAVGDVVVVYAVAPELTGRIEGEVFVGDTGGSGVDAKVTIAETGQTATAVNKGRFAFELLPPGSYTLMATRDGMQSDPVTTDVAVDQTARVELFLRPDVRDGTVNTKVVELSGRPLNGAVVTVGDRSAMTDPAGNATMAAVPAGTYPVVAAKSGYLQTGGQPPIVVEPGQMTTTTVMLTQPTAPTAPPVLVDTMATGRGINKVDASIAVRKTTSERYGNWVRDFAGAASDPAVATSEAYVKAAEFLGTTVTRSTVSDEAVSAAYKDVANSLSMAARQASGDTKTEYQDALASVTVAYLDRLATSNPKTLPAEVSNEVKAVVKGLKTAGVSLDALRTQWGGAQLKDSINVESAEAVDRLLK
jgi:hypothetical protein